MIFKVPFQPKLLCDSMYYLNPCVSRQVSKFSNSSLEKHIRISLIAFSYIITVPWKHTLQPTIASSPVILRNPPSKRDSHKIKLAPGFSTCLLFSCYYDFAHTHKKKPHTTKKTPTKPKNTTPPKKKEKKPQTQKQQQASKKTHKKQIESPNHKMPNTKNPNSE